MRLWDEIVNDGYYTPGLFRKERLLPDAIEHTQVVVADNVARYLYVETDQEHWMINEDFPNIAPPWDTFWIEYRAPALINSEEFGTSPWDGPVEVGTHFVTLPAEAVADRARAKASGQGLSEDWVAADPYEGGWWVVTTMIFKDRVPGMDKAVPVRVPYSPIYRVLPDGTIPNAPDGSVDSKGDIAPYLFYPGDQSSLEELGDAIHDLSRIGLWTQFLALSFCHCKNVTLKEHVPPPKLAKKQAKRGRSLHNYHVLEIEPMTRKISDAQAEHGVGTARALHIMRGHFKDYREGAGLFGKHKDLYWWDMAVRGSAAEGVVEKDYDVKPPRRGGS